MSIATQETKPANGAGTAIAPRQPREVRVVEDHGPLSHLMDTARFEHLQRIASIMASAGILPDHLAGNKHRQFTREEILGNCFQIVNQSFRWGFDPFSVKDETYVVGGKLGYQGKLIAAVINARAGLVHPLRYEHEGNGDGRTVTVIGQFVGEDHPRTITLSVSQGKTSNDMWKKDPDQKLCYTGATKWARRHAPEVIMGVLTDDDLDRIQDSRAAAAQIESNRPRSLGQLTDKLRGADPAGGGTVLDAEQVTGDSGLAPGEYVAEGGEIKKLDIPACCPAAAAALASGHHATMADLEADIAGCRFTDELSLLCEFYCGNETVLETQTQREVATKIIVGVRPKLRTADEQADQTAGPAPTVETLAALARELGCPSDQAQDADQADWAVKQKDPEGYIRSQPWTRKQRQGLLGD